MPVFEKEEEQLQHTKLIAILRIPIFSLGGLKMGHLNESDSNNSNPRQIPFKSTYFTSVNGLRLFQSTGQELREIVDHRACFRFPVREEDEGEKESCLV